MGTIALTVKRNNSKTPLLEAVSKLVLWKNCSSNFTINPHGKSPTSNIYSNQISKGIVLK